MIKKNNNWYKRSRLDKFNRKEIKKDKQHRANRKEIEDLPVKRGTIDLNIKILKKTKIKDFTDVKYS